MPSFKAQVVICDRCGETTYLKHLGKKDLDGGYSSYDEYERLPDDWMYGTEYGYMCPSCASMFKDMVGRFFEGRVSPSWKHKTEEV